MGKVSLYRSASSAGPTGLSSSSSPLPLRCRINKNVLLLTAASVGRCCFTAVVLAELQLVKDCCSCVLVNSNMSVPGETAGI